MPETGPQTTNTTPYVSEKLSETAIERLYVPASDVSYAP
jgi:hypothetical protein